MKRPLAGCVASLLGLVVSATDAAGSGLALHGHALPAAPNFNLPLAGLQAQCAPTQTAAIKARSPGAKVSASVPAKPSRPLIRDRDLLVSAPVSAFGFLSAASLPRTPPVLAHRSYEPGLSRALARSASAPPPAPTANSVVLDSSLGQTQQPVVTTNPSGQNDYGIYGTMGKQLGGNLFFSFSSFNLAAQESATFSGPFALSTPIQNILARVTGGASSIDGLIATSKIPGANFFLLNPAGVIFGPDAQLALGGSFIVSTADSIKLADGNTFNAIPGPNDAALSSAAVAAFGFVSPTPAGVQFNGSQLAAPTGSGLHVIAGPIALDGATLSAPSGALTMFSASSAGNTPFSLVAPGAGYRKASASAGGSIGISNQSSIAIDGQGGGSIILFGGAVAIKSSTISSNNLGSAPGGGITIDAGTLSLTDGGSISASTLGLGSAGAIGVTAGRLTITGDLSDSEPSGIFAQSKSTGAGGAAGAITLDVPGAIIISGGGVVSSTTFGLGSGGSVRLTAGELTVAGGLPDSSSVTEIVTNSESGGAGGAAGNIVVNVRDALTISGGAAISSSTLGSGNGGMVQVTAGQLTISGALPNDMGESGIFAQSASSGAGGAAGAITITVPGALSISGGGLIDSSTSGLGNSGRIRIVAGQLTVTGALSDNYPSGIYASSGAAGLGGAAGDIVINVAGALTVSDGAVISSLTAGLGRGGGVHITAGELTVTGGVPDKSFSSDIDAQSESSGPGGAAGDVTINVAGPLTVSDGGEISSSTFGLGRGGSVNVTAAQLTIAGALGAIPSGIFAGSEAYGPGGAAGAVTVNVTGALTLLGGGQIYSITFTNGRGGSVDVTAGQLTISGAVPGTTSVSGILAESNTNGPGGDAGDVTVSVAGALALSDGGAISSSTSGLGNGGGVQVTAGQLSISGALTDKTVSGIFADSNSNGPGGAAGDVSVNVPGGLTITGGGAISSSTFGQGRGGSVQVAAGQLTIAGGLADRSAASGVFAVSGSTGAGGAAGNVTVTVKRAVDITAGGEISSATNNLGAGGSVQVTAGNLTITGALTDTSVSGIFAESHSTDAGGPAGYVTVEVPGALTIGGGGEISSATAGLGNGGSVQVTAGVISISGSTRDGRAGSEIVATSTATGRGGVAGDVHVDCDSLLLADGGIIASSSTSSGNAGSVAIAAGQISLSGGSTISTSSAKSDAGSISIEAEDTLLLSGGSSISASAGDNGGDITIGCGYLVYLLDSSITATAGTLKSAASDGGAGGNITIDPVFIVLDHSLISANAAVGRGGNILLETDNYLSSESLVTATGSTAGTVTIAAPELDLTNGLVGLSSTLLDVSAQFREQCAERLNQDFSSFLVVGQGGVDSAPDQAQTSGSNEERARRQPAKEPAKKAGHSTANR